MRYVFLNALSISMFPYFMKRKWLSDITMVLMVVFTGALLMLPVFIFIVIESIITEILRSTLYDWALLLSCIPLLIGFVVYLSVKLFSFSPVVKCNKLDAAVKMLHEKPIDQIINNLASMNLLNKWLHFMLIFAHPQSMKIHESFSNNYEIEYPLQILLKFHRKNPQAAQQRFENGSYLFRFSK